MQQQVTREREIVAVNRESGVTLLIFDGPSKYNSLSSRTIEELEITLSKLEEDSRTAAIVIVSGKPDSYVIGADLNEIRKLTEVDDLLKLSQRGQELLNKVQNFSKPIVAAIHGTCLGGGLEMALATHYRIATTDKNTRLGLPETRLGIIPGLGGTQRLPAKIGLKTALDMILSAEPVSAQHALEIGIVEELVERDDLIGVAEKRALSIAAEFKSAKTAGNEGSCASSDASGAVASECDARSQSESGLPAMKATPFCKNDLDKDKAIKLLTVTERAIRVRTRGQYPAQQKAVQVIKEGLEKGFKQGLAAEAQAFAELAAGEVSGNLMSIFFNNDFAKQTAGSLVRKFPGSEVKTVGVLGAGKMGTSLAQIAAARGLNVLLRTDQPKEKINQKLISQLKVISKQSGKNEDDSTISESPEELAARVKIAHSADELKDADLIIECIIEEANAKTKTLGALSESIGPKAVVASNTSCISIAQLSSSVPAPERFVGLHFFHPVDKMELVEVVTHPAASREATARAVDFVLKLGKTPLMVKDGPGFVVNRLVVTYLIEVARLLEEPTPANWIEEAGVDFGMPIGPLQLMDEIGIDVSFTVARLLPPRLGERLTPPSVLERTASLGVQGKASNAGFYLWEDNEKRLGLNPALVEKCDYVFSDQKCPPDQKERLIDRLFLPMVDEAARLLEEKVVSKPREVDLALVLGIGFPAFRGGLLKYADQVGLQQVTRKLDAIYASTTGNRTVSPMLRKYAQEGRGFYSLSGKEE